MLHSLKIQNLILIEKSEIHFEPGLNILTGETGAGKSAILSAISLLCGMRADVQLIRNEAAVCVVEATLSHVDESALKEEGITCSSPVHCRREIHRSGKSRCFIDDHQVSLATLKKCVYSALELVDQSSSTLLCSAQEQRKMLDAFGGLLEDARTLAESMREEKQQEAEQQVLLQAQLQKDRELEWAQKDLALIEETNLSAGEEERLVLEHRRLTHVQELLEKVGGVSTSLSEQGMPLLKRFLASLEQCTRICDQIKPIAQSMKNGILEIEEASQQLVRYVDGLETDPGRLEAVEKRMGALDSLKRRFGSTYDEVKQYKEKLQMKIDHFSNLDEQIQKSQATLQKLQRTNLKLSSELRENRRRASLEFAPLVLVELKSLNLPQAAFTIEVDEEIRFLFSANRGTSPIPLEQCCSGGELSRLLLAIKTILAKGQGCIVFDEIDSNVGGQTATILGEKLKKLSQKQQVICVTHFVQVAKVAHHHFLVSKKDHDSSACTSVTKLSALQREAEYSRMLGI